MTSESMLGFNDITCSACGSRIGWYGMIGEPPKCKCGHDMTEACSGLEEQLAKARAEVLAEIRGKENE